MLDVRFLKISAAGVACTKSNGAVGVEKVQVANVVYSSSASDYVWMKS